MNKLENLGRGVAYVTGYYLSTKATQAGLVKNIDCKYLNCFIKN